LSVIEGSIRGVSRLLMLSRRELLVLVIVFAASLPAVTARLYSSDEVEYFSYLRSLWFDRDVSFENEYQYFYEHRIAQSADFHRTFLTLRTATGLRINYGTLGCAILWSPFYAAGDVTARLLRLLGYAIEVDGYSKPYIAAVAYGSAFYAFAAILLGMAAARRLASAHAVGPGVAVWAGTPLLFYTYVAPPFSHACSAFAVALFITIWLHVRRSWTVSGVVALGLSGALMAMVREQDIFFALGPAADFVAALFTSERGGHRGWMVRPALAGGAAFAVGYTPQLVAYQILNGQPKPSPLVVRKMIWTAPHALQVLVDPQHGFFFWTPLAVLSLAGLVLMASRPRILETAPEGVDARFTPALRGDVRRIGASMLLMFALQVYISGAVESWTVAGAFGQRRFVALTALLVSGLAALRDAVRGATARVVLAVFVALSVWWNIALMAEFGTSLMDRQRLEPGRNAYDAFVTLPRTLPGLLYRYFAHRGSFYQPADVPKSPE
jgi:hypothetical protein